MSNPYKHMYEQDATELQGLVFKTVAKENKYNFEKFVHGYMNCKYRWCMDEGYARFYNMTYDEYLQYLHKDCGEIFVDGESSVDIMQALWIGEMYNRVQFKTNMASSELYKLFPLDKMQILFKPLHTIDEGLARDKIINSIKG